MKFGNKGILQNGRCDFSLKEVKLIFILNYDAGKQFQN